MQAQEDGNVDCGARQAFNAATITMMLGAADVLAIRVASKTDMTSSATKLMKEGLAVSLVAATTDRLIKELCICMQSHQQFKLIVSTCRGKSPWMKGPYEWL